MFLCSIPATICTPERSCADKVKQTEKSSIAAETAPCRHFSLKNIFHSTL